MQINKSKEEFRKDWFEVKYCPLSQSELEVKSKNYWIKKDFSLEDMARFCLDILLL